MPKFGRSEIRKILGDANTEEIENGLIAAYLAVIDPLKDDLARYKADAERLSAVQKELDDLKASGGDWESKYTKEHEDFEEYKKKVAEDAKLDKVKSAFKSILLKLGISEKRANSIIRTTDFTGMDVNNSGLVNADKIEESIKSEWADFIPDTHDEGEHVDNPPLRDNSTPFDNMSLADKMAYANQHPSDPSVTAWLNK